MIFVKLLLKINNISFWGSRYLGRAKSSTIHWTVFNQIWLLNSIELTQSLMCDLIIGLPNSIKLNPKWYWVWLSLISESSIDFCMPGLPSLRFCSCEPTWSHPTRNSTADFFILASENPHPFKTSNCDLWTVLAWLEKNFLNHSKTKIILYVSCKKIISAFGFWSQINEDFLFSREQRPQTFKDSILELSLPLFSNFQDSIKAIVSHSTMYN